MSWVQEIRDRNKKLDSYNVHTRAPHASKLVENKAKTHQQPSMGVQHTASR